MTNPTQNMRRGTSGSGGFTLIEVLVSIVILSIGLLGIAKLMLFSSRSNDSAYLRSQATELAYEILDNMRANRQEAINLTYIHRAGRDGNHGGAARRHLSRRGAVHDHPACLVRRLSMEAALGHGQTSGLPGALPTGRGSVAAATVGTQTTVVIQVFWDDTVAQSTFGAAANQQSITLETVL